MHGLFDPGSREAILDRLARLEPGAARLWGSMSAGQMLAHCSVALEMATGDQPRKQKMIGRVLGPFFKKKLLGDEAFSRNSPTDPAFVVTDQRDFAAEKERLSALVQRFCDEGRDRASGRMHSFLGRLSGEEWGVMMGKHLDHHLRQFGV